MSAIASRHVGEQPRHRLRRLQVALGVAAQPPSGLLERGLVADAGEDVVQRPIGRLGEAHAVGGDDRHVERGGEIAQRLVVRTPPRAGDGAAARRRPARAERCRRSDRRGRRRRSARPSIAVRPASATSPPTWPSRSSKVSAPSPFGARSFIVRHQPAQVAVAVARLDQDGQREQPLRSRGQRSRGSARRLAADRRDRCRSRRRAAGDRQLGADDRLEAGALGGEVKARRAVDAVAIEQRQRRIAERRRALDQRFGQRRAVEKRKGGRGVEFDIHGAHVADASVPGSASRKSRRETTLGRPVLKKPADRAVVERHVPFVAIPALADPTSRPTCATAGGLLDDAARHAAAIDRHARRAAALDGHANGDRRPERRSASRPSDSRDLGADSGSAGPLAPRAAGASEARAESQGSRDRRMRTGAIAHPSGRCVSRSAGEPQRVSPTSAPRRAVSVASVSGDGTARSSSEYWTMRAGRRIDLDGDDVDRRRRRMRLEIEQQQRAQHPRIAHRRRQLQHARVRGAVGEPQIEAQRDRRRDRRARAPRPAVRAAARTRTTAARACRSAIRARSTR